MAKNFIKNVRLSKHVVPIRYKINLTPDLSNFVFTGEEEITLEIRKETNNITLHAVEIEIHEAVIVQGRKFQECKVSYSKKDETATLLFETPINPGKAILKLKFTGILNDKLRGFYRSRYEVEGKTHHMAVSQFESTDARRCIPCFDEPAQKAVFEVSLKIPSDRIAISNTIESEIAEHESGFKTVKFAPSPKMSSYLLAFIVGHFEHIEKKSKNGTLVRVFTTPGKKHQAEFALEVAVKCIEFYENYFAIKYPLPVMDLIAIPDFAAGAMENWGAVTYRETAILVDPRHSSTQNKQWVALVIAHELAHQWFGNLVTLAWWTHLWLNEGFASYMEYVAIDKLFPKWNIWTQFVFIEHARGLTLDGLAATHAIEVDVNHPAEISEIFDAVSYSKGASIIRMLAEYLGEKDFRAGLRKYLKKHAYANANTNDLWDALEDVSGKQVSRIMQNWTRKPGYPLVTVSSKKNKLELSQSRFFSSSQPKADPPLAENIKALDNPLWPIPISVVSSNVKKPKYILFDKDKSSLPFKLRNWVRINTSETSFIRVSYSPELLELLTDPIKNQKISPEDRFGIVRDIFALSQASKMSTDEALKLATYYKSEDNYIVWAELATQILRLSNLLYGQKYFGLFEKYTRNLFENIVQRVGWSKKKNEDYNRTLLRAIVIYVLGKTADKKTIKHAQKLFGQEKHIDPDLCGVVYRLVAENGGRKDYDKLMKLYRQNPLAEEKDRVLRALCSFQQRNLLKKTLDFAFSDEARDQDLIKAFAFVWSNPVGRKLAFEYLKKKWSFIVEKFGGGHLFSRFITPLENLVKYEDTLEIESFFKKNGVAGIERTVSQVLEQIRSNAAWLERDSEKINKFLQK